MTARSLGRRVLFGAAWLICAAMACMSVYFLIVRDFRMLLVALGIQAIAG